MKTAFASLRWPLPTVVVLVLALLPAYNPLAAGTGGEDDDVPVSENGPGKPAAKGEKAEKEKQDAGADLPRGDELQKDEQPKGTTPADEGESDDEIDRIERAIEGMRSAQQRITGEDTSPQTRKIQQQVVKDLEEVLAFLKKQQQNPQNSPQQNQNQNQNQDQEQSQGQRQKLPKGQGDPNNSGSRKAPERGGSPTDGRRTSEKSRESQERTDPARSAARDEARRMQMIKDVWGHLPPHVREALQNAFNEKYLPKYEDLVKKYYEALAEKNRKQTGK